jgi:CRISPR-associated protein Cmr2
MMHGEDPAQLEPCLAPLRADQTPPTNVANKLLAEVPAGVDPAGLARTARNAVMKHWREGLAAPVKTKCDGLLADGIEAIWTEQVDALVEFTASWAPLGDYAEVRRLIEREIASRKVLRDFAPWKHGRGSVPKSSLDGARETVLRPPRERQGMLWRKYRITRGEHLDAIGLVKRAGGEPDQFVPVVNVALAPWVHLAAQVASPELERLKEACRAVGISRVARTDLPCAAPFPFDASVFFASRWESVFNEQGLEGSAEAWGRQHVQPVLHKVSEPCPYVVCLVADGDHMGRAIDRLSSASEHRAFSRALSQFAGAARAIVEQQHCGILVYAGGDDVLAFVPVPEALSCADQLRIRFADLIASATSFLQAELRPTLSVGLGVGHFMESMGDLLALGREAEREAKRDRNALAVVVDKRSGGKRSWRARWDEDPVLRLREGATLLAERLPSRKVHEIASVLSRLPEAAHGETGGWARLLALEVGRSLSRVEGGGLSLETVGLALDERAGYAAVRASVDSWVARLLIARAFMQATPRPRRREEEATA